MADSKNLEEGLDHEIQATLTKCRKPIKLFLNHVSRIREQYQIISKQLMDSKHYVDTQTNILLEVLVSVVKELYE